jgi:hypothetical protein
MTNHSISQCYICSKDFHGGIHASHVPHLMTSSSQAHVQAMPLTCVHTAPAAALVDVKSSASMCRQQTQESISVKLPRDVSVCCAVLRLYLVQMVVACRVLAAEPGEDKASVTNVVFMGMGGTDT